MPKKTKREKIIAEYRHQQAVPFGEPQFQFRMTAGEEKTTTPEFTIIQKDLITTVALAAIAIIGEVFLSRIFR